jgi:hypothetical protein
MPKWAKAFRGSRLIYALGIHIDALIDGTVAAVRRRFPGLDGYGDEIEPLGKERRIRRGRDEPDSSYASRLATWLDDHKTRGGPYAMLRQLHGYFVTAPRNVDLIYENGRRYHMAPDGTVTMSDIAWVTPTATPMRFWVVLEWIEGISGDGTWGDTGTWDDGGLWDFSLIDLSEDLAESLRLVPGDWQPAHVLQAYICVTPPGYDITTVPPTDWDDPDALSALGIARFAVNV